MNTNRRRKEEEEEENKGVQRSIKEEQTATVLLELTRLSV